MTNNKHAYLIMAHTNWEQLQKLVALIDDKRNDIYIHIDNKSDVSCLSLNARYSKLFFIERKNVYWGHVSQICVEMRLFSAAYKVIGG